MPIESHTAGNLKGNVHAILVLGMHRSGTSALTHVIELLGGYAGDADALLPPDPVDNPSGYWELAELNAAHDKFLQSAGYAWNELAGFDARKVDTAAKEEFSSRVREILDALDSGGKPLVLKDPRMGLMLPQWRELLDAPACVVAVRDPREIAASMDDGPRGVYTSHYLLTLWEKYLRATITGLRDQRVLFVSYSRLLAEPKAQAARLLRGLRALGVNELHAAPETELHAFLDPHLQRSIPKPHAQLSAGQQALLAWLQTQSEAPGPVGVSGFPESEAPDAVLFEYRKMLDARAKRSRDEALGEAAIKHAELDAAAATLQTRLEEAESRLQEREQAYARAQTANAAERSKLLAETATKQLEIEAAQMQAVALDSLRRKLEARVVEQRQEHDRQMAELASKREQLAEAEGKREEFEQLANKFNMESQDARHAFTQLESHANALAQGMHDIRHSWSWKITAPLRAIAKMLTPRFSWDIEQKLYRAYYALPGLGIARKRALILWTHRNLPWLSRHTLSYRLNQQTQQLRQQRVDSPAQTQRPRMDQTAADALIGTFRHRPLISIVMPVYNVDKTWLLAAVDSVRRQFYPHWELHIADDASTRTETLQALDDINSKAFDPRIKIVRLKKNVGIAGASNAALESATGDFVGLLDHDDELTRDALLEMAGRIAAEQPDIIYSDEDKLDESGAHVEVHYKPDFSPDYFFSINYICHFAVFRRSLLQGIGGFRTGFDGAQDYDLLLRASESTQKIAHIPKVLYHWRKTAGSTASSSAAKPQTTDAGRRALTESMARRNIMSTIDAGPYPNTFRVRRTILGNPLVSIMVPFRDKADLLETCVSSILKKTRYQNYEILCVDNASTEPATHATLQALEKRDARVRVLRYDAPFNFSAINNFCATHAKGEHLLFLNNDTEVISEEWLESMLEHSQRPEVGVIGARLLYADDTIQHAGVIVGPGGVAGHAHLFTPGDDPGYFARVRLLQNLSAVTFACAMTRRTVFEQLGGLNDRELTIAFNDVDYCLRAREAGYLIVYTPYALLHHYESKSRGYEDTPEKQIRFGAEIRYMQERHKALLEAGDPYYNPNLSLTASFQPDPNYVDELPL